MKQNVIALPADYPPLGDDQHWYYNQTERCIVCGQKFKHYD